MTIDEVPKVIADTVQVEQVLLNLCINARDALNGVGTVNVAVRPLVTADLVCASCLKRIAGDFVELAVCDTGPGIPPDVLKRIFEPFYSTKAVGKGSGMGLAVVHGIVHEHGGHVIVDTFVGRGTTFRILLPPIEVTEETPVRGDASNDRAAGGWIQAARTSSRRRRRAVRRGVHARVAGFLGARGERRDVTPKRPCRCSKLDAQGYDLVITDQTMPRMSGLQLAEEIGRMSAAPPVVLYTGYAEAA